MEKIRQLFRSLSRGRQLAEAGVGAREEQDDVLDILENENEKVKEGLVNIQGNLAECVEINKQCIEEFESLEGDFRTLSGETHQIAAGMKDLDEFVIGAKEKTEEMAGFIKRITVLLTSIIGISDETGLLALNATIEAARAGEAGKSFAVVAEGVKKLSEQSKAVANDISKLVSDIQTTSTEVGEAMGSSAAHCSEIKSAISAFDRMLGEIGATKSAANNRSMERVVNTNNRVFMSLAKLDHVIWKVNTYLSMIKKEAVFKFVDHHNCRLGKWYYEGEGKNNFSDTSSYRTLEMPHSVVHNGTKRVFWLIENDPHNYEAFRLAFQEMENGSDGVFATLDMILNQKSVPHN